MKKKQPLKIHSVFLSKKMRGWGETNLAIRSSQLERIILPSFSSLLVSLQKRFPYSVGKRNNAQEKNFQKQVQHSMRFMLTAFLTVGISPRRHTRFKKLFRFLNSNPNERMKAEIKAEFSDIGWREILPVVRAFHRMEKTIKPLDLGPRFGPAEHTMVHTFIQLQRIFHKIEKYTFEYGKK